MTAPTTIKDLGRANAAVSPQVTAAFENNMLSLSGGYTYNSTTGSDLYQTAKRVGHSNDERSMYNEFWDIFLESDLAQFLVLNLVSNLMDFRFESEDEEALNAVRDFFYMNDTEEELIQMLINAFVFGTGIGQRHAVGTRLDYVSRIDAKTIRIEKMGRKKGRLTFKYIQEQVEHDEKNVPRKVKKELATSRILTFKPVEVPDDAHGKSMIHSSLLPLQAIQQLNMDIPAGLKRLAYETMVLYLNMEGVPEAKQKTMMSKALKSFAKYDSATNSVIALDERHSLKYVGSDGGSTQKVVPILDMIEPLLIFLLNKWYVPLGDVLQEKSNRALATTQTSTSRLRLRQLKQRFAKFVEKEIIAYITDDVGTRPKVRVVHNTPFVEQKEEIDTLMALWNNNLVTRELVQSKLPYGDLDGMYLNDLQLEQLRANQEMMQEFAPNDQGEESGGQQSDETNREDEQ